MSEMCKRQEELREEVYRILTEIDTINRGQMEALASGDDEQLMALDKKLELKFGEKERCFGALFQHRDEHGC